MLEPTSTVRVRSASCDRVPHATPLHEERAASSVNQQAAAAATISPAIDDVDVSQREARAVGHFDGAGYALGIKGRPIGAEALEGQVNAAHVERRAAEGIAARKADHARTRRAACNDVAQLRRRVGRQPTGRQRWEERAWRRRQRRWRRWLSGRGMRAERVEAAVGAVATEPA